MNVDDATPIFVLADDLTGALDCAAVFATEGIATFVVLNMDIGAPPESDVVSVNADTRRMPAHEATQAVREVIAGITESGGVLRYVKIDSTLRGHPGLEIGVAANVPGADLVLVAPSFPATGRTVRDGELLVHGVPLAETEVGKDPLSPVKTSNVANVLRQHTGPDVRGLPLPTVRSARLIEELSGLIGSGGEARPALVVCDAETDQDLDALVHAGLQIESSSLSDDDTNRVRVLFAGSAGLASSLARALHIESNNNVKTPPKLLPPVLVVTASQQSLADEQITALTDAGIAELWPLSFGKIGSGRPETVDVNRSAINASLERRHNVVIKASLELDLGTISHDELRSAADRITRQVGRLVSELVSDNQIGGLVIIGGDTAFAVLSAVEARGIVLAAEPLPGVALGTISGGKLNGVGIATKAGAFGDRKTLVKLFKHLLQNGQHN